MKARGREKMAKYKSENKRYVVYQRVLAIVALAGLFACGLMVGFAVNGAKKISSKVSQVVGVVEDISLPQRNCAAVEKLLKAKLKEETDATDCWAFNDNIIIYDNLIDKGCPENHEKYVALKNRSSELAAAACINDNQQMIIDDGRSTCEKIRDEMLFYTDLNASGYDGHMRNAKTYAVIAERGCASEAEHYKELAEQELAVARAVVDDNLNEQDTIDVIEVYKKIQMQTAAEEVFEKMKKITNPAIDFILEVEKIINE